MANAYTVKVNSVVSDGTNIYVDVTISTGIQVLPNISIVFPVGTTRAQVVAYLQNIANTQPTFPSDMGDLVSAVIVGQ